MKIEFAGTKAFVSSHTTPSMFYRLNQFANFVETLVVVPDLDHAPTPRAPTPGLRRALDRPVALGAHEGAIDTAPPAGLFRGDVAVVRFLTSKGT